MNAMEPTKYELQKGKWTTNVAVLWLVGNTNGDTYIHNSVTWPICWSNLAFCWRLPWWKLRANGDSSTVTTDNTSPCVPLNCMRSFLVLRCFIYTLIWFCAGRNRSWNQSFYEFHLNIIRQRLIASVFLEYSKSVNKDISLTNCTIFSRLSLLKLPFSFEPLT